LQTIIFSTNFSARFATFYEVAQSYGKLPDFTLSFSKEILMNSLLRKDLQLPNGSSKIQLDKCRYSVTIFIK
jgi:hypothetical protein